jgi:hypothetical protein
LARCKAYEVKGPDPSRTSAAERCAREAVAKSVINGKTYAICKRHQGGRWRLFVDGGWLYAVDLRAEPVLKRKKKK